MPGKSPKLSILTKPFFTYFSRPLVACWDGPCEAADICYTGYSCCCSVILKSLGFLLSRTGVSLLSPFKTFSITVPSPRPRVIVLLSSSQNQDSPGTSRPPSWPLQLPVVLLSSLLTQGRHCPPVGYLPASVAGLNSGSLLCSLSLFIFFHIAFAHCWFLLCLNPQSPWPKINRGSEPSQCFKLTSSLLSSYFEPSVKVDGESSEERGSAVIPQCAFSWGVIVVMSGQGPGVEETDDESWTLSHCRGKDPEIPTSVLCSLLYWRA